MTFLAANFPIEEGLEEVIPGFVWASQHPAPPQDSEHLHVLFSGDLLNLKQLRRRFRRPDASEEELIADLFLAEGGNLDAAHGAFAALVIDSRRRRIHGFTDHSGVGELYYIHKGNHVLISSDLRRLLSFSDASLDSGAVARFFALGSPDRRETLLADVRKISHFYTLAFDGTLRIQDDYLSVLSRIKCDHKLTERAVLDEMDRLLREGIAQLRNSARPICNTLSGGVDSSLLQVFLSAHAQDTSFSIAFERFGDDNRYAQDIADVLKTAHTALVFDRSEFLSYVRRGVIVTGKPYIYQGEAIFQRLYKAIARSDSRAIVTSGQTADALIGAGVPRSLIAAQRAPFLPASLIRLLARRLPSSSRELVLAFRAGNLSREIIAATQDVPPTVDRTLRYLGYDCDVFGPSFELGQRFSGGLLDILSRIHLFQGEYMRLPSVWWSLAAAEGLSLTFPFAEPSFVEFLLSVPLALKARGFQTKYLGKKLLARYLPPRYVYRPKLQFRERWDDISRTDAIAAQVLDELRSASYFEFDVDNLVATEDYTLLLRLINFHFWMVNVLEPGRKA